MSTVIYKEPYKRGASAVAHVNDKGLIFSDPEKEMGLECGHVGDGGRVYSHPTMKAGYCLGHVDGEGRIYDHPTSKTGHCVGYVNEDGVVYSTPDGVLGSEVGHVSGPHYREAAVYYLLGMDNKKGIDLSKVAKVAKTVGSAVGGGGGGGGSSQSTAENVKDSSSSQSTVKNVSSPSVNVDASGNFSIFVFIFILAIAVGLVGAIKHMVLNFPGFILLFVYVVKAFLTPAVRADIHKFNVSDADRQRARDYAKGSLIPHAILPVILGIYTVIRESSSGYFNLILTVLPTIAILLMVYLCNYKKSLYEADKLNIARKNAPAPKVTVKKERAKPSSAEKTVTKETVKTAKEEKKAESSDNKVIVECENCQTKMRIPAGKGKVKVKCPKCQSENVFNT